MGSIHPSLVARAAAAGADLTTDDALRFWLSAVGGWILAGTTDRLGALSTHDADQVSDPSFWA